MAIIMDPKTDINTRSFNAELSFLPLLRVFRDRVAQNDSGQGYYHYLLSGIETVPELNQSISDTSILLQHRVLVEDIIHTLFPVTKNDMEDLYAVMVPFTGQLIYSSAAFSRLFPIDEDGRFTMPGSADEWQWHTERQAGAFQLVLKQCYDIHIPGEVCAVQSYQCPETGLERYMEMRVDTNFIDVVRTGELPAIPEEFKSKKYRIEDLVNDPQLMEWLNMDLFRFEGFGILEVREVTEREVLNSIRNSLLDLPSFSDTETLQSLQKQLEILLGRSGITIGITPLFRLNNAPVFTEMYSSGSIVMKNQAAPEEAKELVDQLESIFKESREPLLIPSINEEAIQRYSFLGWIKEQGFCGLIMIPLLNEGHFAGTMEIVMKNEGLFDDQVLQKVIPAIPLFERAIQNISEKLDAQIDKVIKEQFTAVQPSVEWKFNEAALEYITVSASKENAKVPPVTFENVYPLYGAIDIRNSSTERNKAIQDDLLEQLQMASSIIRKAKKISPYPLLKEVDYKIRKYAHSVSNIVLSDEEMLIHYFLKQDVVTLFQHLRTVCPALSEDITQYFMEVSSPVDMLYKHRKDFDESITQINMAVSRFIDHEQRHAQKMYPHYFERFVTDGVDFNIYVGQSINPDHPFDPFYLHNIKLWQLATLAKAARLSKRLESEVPVPLQTTQLILAHSNPISISFRPAERKFDVDGAYNIRYEIIKKRIDKVCIRDTNERLTKPGTIAIVYTIESEAKEYEQYIEFLQHENLLKGEIERYELEELQGVTGLKALRIGINFDRETKDGEKSRIEKAASS